MSSRWIRRLILIGIHAALILMLTTFSHLLPEPFDRLDSVGLWYASATGRARCVRVLLLLGADPNCEYFLGLDGAIWGGHTDIAKTLLEHGSDPNFRHRVGATCLHTAAVFGEAEIARLLIEYGARVDATTRGGSTPLALAAHQGDVETVRVLLDNGADLHARNNHGSTVLHSAASSGHPAVVRLLLERGAEPSPRDTKGRTPLAYVAEREQCWRNSYAGAPETRPEPEHPNSPVPDRRNRVVTKGEIRQKLVELQQVRETLQEAVEKRRAEAP